MAKGGKKSGKKKGGKKKSSKLANMTEEERIAYEEQKALAEEELRKKKENMLTQFLKDKLTKEERSTKFNINKLNHQWRNIMRENKSKELKKDLEILSQTFERIVDRKDATIKALAKDLQEADEQYSMALRAHLQSTDNLIDQHKSRIEFLRRQYDDELAVITEEFDTERAIMLDQHSRETNEISDILFAMDQNFQEREREAKSDFQSLVDEIRNKDMEEMHGLRHQLTEKFNFYWNAFEQARKNYQENNAERKAAFEELKLKDDGSAQEIDFQMRKLQRISENIAQLKSKMASNAKENEQRNRSIKEERERMLAHLQDLKAEMNKLRDGERAKLTKMTVESNTAIKTMKSKVEKVKNVITMAEMCRRLETEEEKVLPFYASSLTEEEQQDVEAAIQEQPYEKLSLIMHEFTSLENFWKRFNKVTLDKLALDKEKQTLVQENTQLRSLLKQYLDGISVNDEILSQVNPLLVVNNRTNVNLNVPVSDPRVRRPVPQTVVEAATHSRQLKLT